MGFLRNTLILSVGIFLGRIAGFFREISLASYFGVTTEADVAVILLTLPDMFVTLLATGALSAALIPEFARRGPGVRSQALFVQVSVLVGLVFFAMAFLLGFFSDSLLFIFAPGLMMESAFQAPDLLKNVLWMMPLAALAGVATSYLHASNRFLMPSLSTFIYNGILVVGILYFLDPVRPLGSLTTIVVVAALARWIAQLSRAPWSPLATRSLRWGLIRRPLMIRYAQAIGAAGILILFPVIARSLASLVEAGGIALVNYALKLVEFPLGFSITVVSVAIFPVLSKAIAHGQQTESELRKALYWVLLLSLSMLFILYGFRYTIVEVAFGWGRMSKEDLTTLAQLFGIGVLAIPFQGISSLMVAVFNAYRDTRTPLKINIGAVIAFVPFAWGLVVALSLQGIIIAMVVIFICIAVVQGILLKRLHGVSFLGLLPIRRFLVLVAVLYVLAYASVLIAQSFDANRWLSFGMAVGAGVVLLVSGMFVMGGLREFLSVESGKAIT